MLEFDTAPHTLNLKALFLPFLPPAPFPCGLIKARQALEDERLGQKRLPRGRREHSDDVAKWNESTEDTVRQTEVEQSDVGENETFRAAFGQSVRMEGDAGQTEVAGESWNETLVDSVTQKPLGGGETGWQAGVPEHEEALEGTARPGEPGSSPAPWSEATQGPVRQNETTAPAARQNERVESAAGKNQTGASAGGNRTEAIQTTHDGLNQSSDWGGVSNTPRLAQTNVSSTLEHNDARITGGMLCHRGHCPWQVILFFQAYHKSHT